MTSNTDYVLFRSPFVDTLVPVEKPKSIHRPAEVDSKEKQDTDVGKVESDEKKDKGAAKDDPENRPTLVQFVMWSQEEVDVDRWEEGNERDFKVGDCKSQMGFLGEEAGEKALEETEMQLEEEKLTLSNVGAKTDIRALFDSDSDSDSDL